MSLPSGRSQHPRVRGPRSIPATLAVFVVATMVSSCSPWRAGAAYLARQIDARPAQYSVRIERHVTLRTSDGTELATDIFHPIGPEKTPTILVRLPYSRTLYNRMAESSSERSGQNVVTPPSFKGHADAMSREAPIIRCCTRDRTESILFAGSSGKVGSTGSWRCGADHTSASRNGWSAIRAIQRHRR